MGQTQSRSRLSALLGSTAMVFTAFAGNYAAWAQDQQDQQQQQAEEPAVEEIVVTGSRVRRTEFSSITPIQVVDAESARDLGIVNFDDILAVGSTVTGGIQFDTNVANNFVTNNGPGTSTIALRGLGADRTLVLINGRRFAPSGVQGAPSNPDVNLIPTLAIERPEVLLDGAGSVYGSDAIAGVINVILRDDFHGMMLDGVANITEGGGGFTGRLGGIFGWQGERGGFTFSAEYFRRKELRVADRPEVFTSRDDNDVCNRDIQISTETGEVVDDVCAGTIGAVGALPIFTPEPDIISFGGGGAFGSFPAIRFEEGSTEVFGIPNFSFVREDDDQSSVRQDANDFQENQLIAPLERISTFFTGHYDLSDYAEAFVEASYSNIRGSNDSGDQQFFPTIPGLVEQLDADGNVVVNPDGTPALVPNPLNPFGQFGLPVTVVQFVDGTGNLRFEREQYRLVGGLRGNLGFLGDNWFSRWDYDVSASYSRSLGIASQRRLLEERLVAATQTVQVDAQGNPVCGRSLQGFTDFFGFLEDVPCVPLNFFAPGVFQNQEISDEELEFLLGDVSSDTKIAQSLITGFVTGDLPFDLPGGTPGMAFGAEWREDSINTNNDTIRELGLAAGFQSDADSRGSFSQYELFTELVLPVLRNESFAHSLDIEVAGRFIDNELFGTEGVWSIKGGWSPTPSLLIRATAGTSFRTPNLNFLFLGGTSGFLPGSADPCDTPPPDPQGNDPRDQTVIDNCQALGIDPFNFNSPGIEVLSTGSPDLDPEESFAWSAGASFDQPFTDWMDLRLSATYWEIEVENGIDRPGGGSILDECLESQNLSSVFCTRIERDPVTRFVTQVDNTPFNLGTEDVRGIDLTMEAAKDVRAMDRNFSVLVNGSVTRTLEDETVTVIGGDEFTESDLGDLGNPRWRFTGTFRVTSGPFEFLWNSTWRSRTFDDEEDRADPTLNDDDIEVFDDDILEAVAFHRVSLSYNLDRWSFNVGVRNVFDKGPPLLDNSFDLGPNVAFGATDSDAFLGRTFTFGIQASM